MANVIKYSTTTPTNQSTLRRGNTVIAVGNAATSQFHSAGFKNGVDIPEGGYVVYTIGLNNNPKAFIAQDDNDLPAIARTLGGGNLTVLEAKVFLNAHTTTWTLNSFPPNIVTDGLVYYSDAGDMTSFMNNEPIVNLITQMVGTTTISFPQTVYRCSALETNVVDSSSPGGQYSRFTGIDGSSNNQLYSKFNSAGIDVRNTTITYSVYLKGSGTCHLTIYADNASYGVSPTITLTSNWTRYTYTRAVTNYTTNCWVAVRGVLNSTNVYIAAQQAELNSSATDFVNGTRPQNTLLNDLSGGSNTGTLINGVGFNEGGYLEFDEVDDYVELGNPSSLQLGSNFSITSTVKPDSVNWGYFFDKGYGTNNCLTFGTHSTSGGRWFFTTYYNGYNYIYFGTPTVGKWAYLSMTFDGTNIRVYENGVLMNTDSWTYDMLTNNTSIRIGGSSSNRKWGGGIATTKMYDKVLSQTEVLQNYHQAPIVTDGLVFAADAGNLVSYESGSTTAYSLTGSFDGTLNNGVGFTSGNGGAWEFDGTDDGIKFETGINFSGDDAITITGWLYVTGGGSWDRWFSGANGTSFHRPDLAILANGDIGFYFSNLNTSWIDTNISIGLNTWALVSYVFKDDGEVKIYIDGGIVYSNTFTAGTLPTNYNFMLGNRYDFNGEAIIGKIGSVSIYNKALTAAEVTQNYNAQSSRFQ